MLIDTEDFTFMQLHAVKNTTAPPGYSGLVFELWGIDGSILLLRQSLLLGTISSIERAGGVNSLPVSWWSKTLRKLNLPKSAMPRNKNQKPIIVKSELKRIYLIEDPSADLIFGLSLADLLECLYISSILSEVPSLPETWIKSTISEGICSSANVKLEKFRNSK